MSRGKATLVYRRVVRTLNGKEQERKSRPADSTFFGRRFWCMLVIQDKLRERILGAEREESLSPVRPSKANAQEIPATTTEDSEERDGVEPESESHPGRWNFVWIHACDYVNYTLVLDTHEKWVVAQSISRLWLERCRPSFVGMRRAPSLDFQFVLSSGVIFYHSVCWWLVWRLVNVVCSN